MPSPNTSSRFAHQAVVALAAGLLLSGCSLDDTEQKTETADTTVAEAVTAVEVKDARSGSIEVTPGTGPGVTVHRTVHYRGDTAPKPGQQVSGGVLTFTDGCSDTCFIDYRLEVPASAAVTLESSSGNVTVAGVAAADLASSSGDVKVEGIAGPLKVRTSSGSVTATGLAGPTAEIHASSGDARLTFAKPPTSVTAKTSSGDVSLTVPQAPYEITTATASGKQETLPTTPKAPSHLSIQTSSGDIRIAGA
ncbi:DUF4097 family beta strand repeat-containing protein [Streptomyces sp. NBC_01296]|uniref:DUF4097 family beta strand repeat-containing protein n=1 Tax=Streptomyces sp. NBC_01296 TaxID=2903816 RepID=UPI002E152E74|nr:DUF4097 family beta strand repeat-containing protein [Streptomyces sp. NBC_01296]